VSTSARWSAGLQEEAPLEPDSQIVIGPDGTVLAATGDFPLGLVDSRLQDCEGLAHEIREAGTALLHQLRCSGNRVAIQTVAPGGGGQRVQLIAIEALAIRRAATDMRALLASKLSVISFQASAVEVTLHVVVADDVPDSVDVDSEKVSWAVTTLVGNALRYVESGSRRTPGGRIDVRVGFHPAYGHLVLEVQDDGPGIPPDTVTRLFKRDGLNVQGAGLALLLIREICVAHGGTIDLRSHVGRSEHGTTVRLTFPTRDSGSLHGGLDNDFTRSQLRHPDLPTPRRR
jgi:signal transduction histidine kinase